MMINTKTESDIALSELIDDLCDIAKQAGKIEKEIFLGDFKTEIKKDGSPVTIADKKAEDIIYNCLSKLTPDIAFIGEESVAGGNIPDISSGTYWLVDPLDGTKEFVNGGGEFTVNIALIENFEPTIGVIYLPMTGKIYAATTNGGMAFMQQAEGEEKIKLQAREPAKEGLTVVTSKRHGNPKKIEDFLKGYKVANMLSCSSSMKFCTVAEGRADLYPRLGPTCEWDIAAGDAILRTAGGHIIDITGKPISYGKVADKFLNDEFIACSKYLVDSVVEALL